MSAARIDPADPRWDAYVRAHPRATIYQLGLELVLAVTVRRGGGGAPDRWPIDVAAAYDEDLQSFEVVPRLSGS